MNKDKAIAESVDKALDLTFVKDVLVKPLAVQMVTKVTETPIPTKKTDKDTGAKEYKKTEKKTEKVESNFRRGVVISLPKDLVVPYSVGDTVVFAARAAFPFDLYKDSMLIKSFDIVAYTPAK